MAGLLGRKSKKKAQVELNNELPFFDVHYLGRTLTKTKMGRECTKSAVADLVAKASGRELQTVSLTISSRGIWVTEKSGQGNGRETFIPIYSVTYGAADRDYPNVFTIVTMCNPQNGEERGSKVKKDADGSVDGSSSIAVNSKGNVGDYQALKSAKSSRGEVFVCHAFICRDPFLARAMVVYLLKAFKAAFEAWTRCLKSEKLREKIKAGPGAVHDAHTAGNGNTSNAEVSLSGDLPRLDPAVRPPEETTALVDKVAAWMDKWFHLGSGKKQNGSGAGDDRSSTSTDLHEEFSMRMREFSDPTLLNTDVDIEKELRNVEVCSALNEIVNRTAGDGSSPAISNGVA